jgi:hypothetical protein
MSKTGSKVKGEERRYAVWREKLLFLLNKKVNILAEQNKLNIDKI